MACDEREFFSIYDYGTDREVHYHGYVYYAGEPTGNEYRSVEKCGAIISLDEFIYALQADAPFEWADDIKEYIEDVPSERIDDLLNSYYGESDGSTGPGQQVSIDDILAGLPSGDYWICSEELIRS